MYPPQIGNVEKLQQAVLDGYGWFLKDQSSRSTNVYHDDIILYYIHVNADMVKMFISLSCVKYIWHHYHYHDQNNKFRSGTIINNLYSQTGPCEQVPEKSPRVSGKKSHFQRTNEYPAIFNETLDIGFFIFLYLKNNQRFMFCTFHDL